MPSISISIGKPVYLPGECVSGQLILENEEKQKSKFLKIAILGEVHNHWTESESRTRTNANGQSENYSETISYDAKVEIINQYKLMWNFENAQPIPIGTVAYDFSFFLPSDCPPSFHGFYGKITYKIMATLERPWKCNVTDQKIFEVIPIMDLSTIPNSTKSLECTKSKTTGLIFKNGAFEVMTSIPKMGWIPGEHIPISISIINDSSDPVVQIQAKLSRHSNHTAYRNGNTNIRPHFKHECKRAVEIERKVEIPPNSKKLEEIQLMVPYETVQSFETAISHNKYFVEVKAKTSSTFKNSLLIELPITVGTVDTTVPRSFMVESPPSYSDPAPPSYKEVMNETKF